MHIVERNVETLLNRLGGLFHAAGICHCGGELVIARRAAVCECDRRAHCVIAEHSLECCYALSIGEVRQ